MIAESQTQHHIVVWGRPLGQFNIMACGPPLLDNEAGEVFGEVDVHV